MKLKNAIIAILILCMTLGLASCGRMIRNAIIKGATGGAVDVSGDGDEVTFTGEDGDAVISVGEDMKWPDDVMGDVPKPQATITAIFKDESAKACTVTFEKMSKGDAQDYLAALKGLGYGNGLDFSDSESLMFSGTKESGEGIMFTYNIADGTGLISYSENADE